MVYFTNKKSKFLVMLQIQKNWGPVWFRKCLIGISLLFFFLMILNELRIDLAYRFVPGPILFFSEIAGLFPNAKDQDVEFRAEGWACQEGRYVEMDLKNFFPIQADNKENRFQRAMYFYHRQQKVLQALGQYLTALQNKWVQVHEHPSKNFDSELGKIGGVRLLSVTTPIPTLDQGVERFHWQSLDAFPFEHVKTWYESPSKAIWERCQ